jgi:hypothetical protein
LLAYENKRINWKKKPSIILKAAGHAQFAEHFREEENQRRKTKEKEFDPRARRRSRR